MTVYNEQPASIDSWMNKNTPTANNSGDTLLYSSSHSTYSYRPILKFAFTGVPTGGISINSLIFSLYCTSYGTGGTISLYRVLLPWTNAGVTWNKYDASNNWNGAGCSTDGSDKSSTLLGSAVISATGWLNFTLDTTESRTMIASNNGLVVYPTSTFTADNLFASSENATTANRPKIALDYTEENNGTKGVTPVGAIKQWVEEQQKKYWFMDYLKQRGAVAI